MVVEIITIPADALEDMILRASKLSASIALEEVANPVPELMDKKTLANYRQCSISKINRNMKNGMPYYLDGGEPRFYKSEIDEWIRSGKAKNGGK